MTGFLLVNPRSGSADQHEAHELCRRAAELDVRTHLLAPDDDVETLAREADAGALGVAGGDGSLALVAAVAVERGLPFACVPFGTRNHFARDLGLDLDDPPAALAAFSGGRERTIDLARVGERPFLNNVSLGLYARLVHRREHHRRRGDYLASVRALALAARERHPVPVRVDGAPVAARVVLVANNDYELALFSLGARPRLDQGKLHLYATTGLLPGRWHEHEAERFRIESSAGTMRAAVDGEPVDLEPPLDFSVRPGALRVLVPPGR